LGQVLSPLRRHNEALAAYDRAISLKPDLAEAWFGRGQALTALRHYGEAYAAYDRAIKLMPELDYALGKWLHARMHCCFWEDIEKAYKRVLIEVSHGRKAASAFNLLSIPSTLSEQKIAAETYAADNFPRELINPRPLLLLTLARFGLVIFRPTFTVMPPRT
jgi:protein O-GlcNAc transferase